MSDADVIAALRKSLGNQGVACASAPDSDGILHCVGIGNGAYVALKFEPTPTDETEAKQFASRAGDIAASVVSQMSKASRAHG